MMLRTGRLDEVDLRLLELLEGEGRMSNADLACRVGLSQSACLRRVRRLERDRIITGYQAVIDRSATGRAFSVFVEISLRSQHEDHLDLFEAAILECPEIEACHLMAGDYDYLLHVVVADPADYERVHRTSLALLPGVDRLRSSFALRTVCKTTALPV